MSASTGPGRDRGDPGFVSDRYLGVQGQEVTEMQYRIFAGIDWGGRADPKTAGVGDWRG